MSVLAGVLSCIAALAQSSAAEPNSTAPVLPEVVVTGAGAPLESLTVPSVTNALERIRTTPGGVDLIPAEQFRTGRTATLKDVLEYSPGVFIQERFGSEEARVSIRGSGLQRTFHGRGISLLQDCVPLNLADGGFDMQAVEPLSACYLEVFRGANALKYGALTLGGAVNYVSPTGYDASRVQLRGEAGSYGYARAQASSGLVLGPADYYASISHLSLDGFRDHARQNNQRLFSNIGYRLSDQLETRFYFTAVTTDSELPGNLTKAQLETDPRQAAAGNLTLNQQRDFDLVRVANKTTWKGGQGELALSGWWSHKDLFHPIFQLLDQNSNDLGADAHYRHDSDLFGRENHFVLGFRPTYGWIEDNRFVNVGGQRGARTGDARETSYNLDFYLENQHRLTDKLALITGVQFSYANRDFEDAFLADGNQTENQDYFGANPKLGLRYDLDEHIQLYGNLSRSFEPPSFGELVRPPTALATPVNGLLQLDAQTATTMEFGTRGERGRFAWDVSWYHAWVEDELLGYNVPVIGAPPGTFAAATVNASSTLHEGVELGGTMRLWGNPPLARQDASAGDHLDLRLAYQWNYFRFSDDGNFGNNQLPGVPEHFARAELVYKHSCGFYGGPDVEWVPVKSPVDMANSYFTDPYALLGCKLGWQSKRGFSVFVEARNLTDKKYAATTGVIVNAGGVDTAQFLPGTGRTFYGGIEWKW